MAEASAAPDRTLTLLRTELLHSKWVQGLAVSMALFVIFAITRSDFSPYKQHVLLADSLLHGRLDIPNPPDYLELYRTDGRAYVIDPPAPSVLLMPFVAIWGTSVDHVLVSMLIGSTAMGLLWVATRQLGWELKLSIALTALFALGTDFWWASTDGGLWTFNHITSLLFLMCALVEATGSKRPWLVGLLVGMSGLARLPTFMAFPFFLYLVLRDEGRRPWKEFLTDGENQRRAALFVGGLGVMAGIYLLYNYGRYGTIWDEGWNDPNDLVPEVFTHGRFDMSYIPRHIEAIFFRPPILDESEFPYFRPSVLGTALFFTTPAFLFCFNAKINRLTGFAIIATLATAAPEVVHGATGWTQFGYRYSLDWFPMLLILMASGLRHQLNAPKVSLITLSCLIGLWGTLAFNKPDWLIAAG